jgi:hypothetical protein
MVATLARWGGGVLEGYLLALYYVLVHWIKRPCVCPKNAFQYGLLFRIYDCSPKLLFPEFLRLVQKPCFRTVSCPEFM